MRSKKQIEILIVAFVFLLICLNSVFAHTPHDDVYGLELSPEYAIDNRAYTIIRGNFFLSEDGGETWERQVRGLDNAHGFRSLTRSSRAKNVLYLSSIGDGVYKSVDGGHTWRSINNNLTDHNIRQIVASKNSPDIVLAVGNQSGIYRTGDGGANWQEIKQGIPKDSHLTAISFVSEQSQRVYAGDQGGKLYISEDLGESWSLCCSIPTSGAITTFAFSGDEVNDFTLYVGTAKGGIFSSTDGGKTFFSHQDQGVEENYIQSLLVSPTFTTDNTLYAVTRHEGVFRSEDGGARWRTVNTGLFTNEQAFAYRRPTFSIVRASETFAQDRTLFLGTFTGIYKTEDRGDSWEPKETLPEEIIVGMAVSPPIESAQMVGVTHYVGDAYLFDGQGRSFHVNFEQGFAGMDSVESLLSPLIKRARFGLDPSRLLNSPIRLHDIAFSPDFATDKTAFVTLKNHLVKTEDAGLSWQAININVDAAEFESEKGHAKNLVGYVLAISPEYKSDNTLFMGTQDGLIIRSTDRGDTFVTMNTIADKFTGLQISPEFGKDKTLFAAGYNTGIHKSADEGKTWFPVNTGLNIESGLLAGEFHLAISPDYAIDRTLFVGSVAGLFRSTDAGESWSKVDCETCEPDWNVAAVAVSPDVANDGIVIISVKGSGIFKSTDGGLSFTAVEKSLIENNNSIGNLSNSPATSGALKFSPNFAVDKRVYGFSGTSLMRSEDGGDTWAIVPNSYFEPSHSVKVNLKFDQNLNNMFLLLGAVLFATLMVVFGIWLLRRSRAKGSSLRQAMQDGLNHAS